MYLFHLSCQFIDLEPTLRGFSDRHVSLLYLYKCILVIHCKPYLGKKKELVLDLGQTSSICRAFIDLSSVHSHQALSYPQYEITTLYM
jgi:hypothetical protein